MVRPRTLFVQLSLLACVPFSSGAGEAVFREYCARSHDIAHCDTYLHQLRSRPDARSEFYIRRIFSPDSITPPEACTHPEWDGKSLGQYMMTLGKSAPACERAGMERLIPQIDSLQGVEEKLGAYQALLAWVVDMESFQSARLDDEAALLYLASPIKRPIDVLAYRPEFVLIQSEYYRLYLRKLRFAHYNDDRLWMLRALLFFHDYFLHQHGLEATCSGLRELLPPFMLTHSGRQQVRSILNRCYADEEAEKVWLEALRSFLSAYPYLESHARAANARYLWSVAACDGLAEDVAFFRSIRKRRIADAMLDAELQAADIVVAEKLWLLGQRRQAQHIVDNLYASDPQQTESGMQILYRLGYRPSITQQSLLRKEFDLRHPPIGRPELRALIEQRWNDYWADWVKHFEQYPARQCGRP